MEIKNDIDKISVLDALSLYTDVHRGIIRDEALCPRCKRRGISPLRPTIKINNKLNEWYCYRCKCGGGVEEVFRILMELSPEDTQTEIDSLLHQTQVDAKKNTPKTSPTSAKTAFKPPVILNQKQKILGSLS